MNTETHSQLANFIWSICNLLRGPYKRNEYRKVILPLTVLRRFDALLAPTKKAVLKKYKQTRTKPDTVIRRLLEEVTGLGDETYSVGRACVAPHTLGTVIVKADRFRFRLNSSQAHSPFVALQLSVIANRLAGALATGTTRGRMNLSATENREVALPFLPEQTAIAAYLDRENAKIDKLIEKVEAAIERLKEYRTTLITAAVTGKIDVRNQGSKKEAA